MVEEPLLDRYADGTHQAHNPEWGEPDAPVKARWVAEMLERNHLVPTALADVGCGTAGVLRRLSDSLPKPCRFVGYEPSPDAFALAEQMRGAASIELVNGDLPADEHVDVLLVMDVIEHVENPFAFLRSLRPHGDHLICYIPLDLSVQT